MWSDLELLRSVQAWFYWIGIVLVLIGVFVSVSGRFVEGQVKKLAFLSAPLSSVEAALVVTLAGSLGGSRSDVTRNDESTLALVTPGQDTLTLTSYQITTVPAERRFVRVTAEFRLPPASRAPELTLHSLQRSLHAEASVVPLQHLLQELSEADRRLRDGQLTVQINSLEAKAFPVPQSALTKELGLRIPLSGLVDD